ncbi:MAG: sigma 54-interacting transcriptional regulator [Polyangiaceae bacterium]
MSTRITTRLDRSAPVHAASLSVLYGPDRGLVAEVPPAGVVVGADPGADVTLKDPAVSGRHCSVRRTNAGFEVKDLGSKNGVLFDGALIERAVLRPGSTVRLGSTVLLLAPEDAPVVLPPSEASSFGQLVGNSLAMRRVYAVLERVSASAASVLILGESGTGKELCARAIHEASNRKSGPFVVFDASAASESLVESALFGHAKGAFTGADRERRGAFAAAHGGTLFIDEIGEFPLRLQPKLLRMLESGEVQPLGAEKYSRYDVRIVAATHRDLAAEVAQGTFRGDVYFRLAVVEVELPPLRERPEDIALIASALLSREGINLKATELCGPNLDRLMNYGFAGNVRELRNILSRAVALSSPGTPFAEMPIMVGSTTASRAEPPASADRPFSDAKLEVVERFERAYLRDLLARYGENLTHAARVAGIERKHLYRLLDKHGLRATTPETS